MAMAAPRLDHVVHAVRDLDTADAVFRHLGFVTTPRNLHSFGTGNHLVVFDETFLELIGVVDDGKLQAPAAGSFSMGLHVAEFLADREGIAMICLKSPDCDADAAALRAAGITVHGPDEFFRTGEMPDGRLADVRGRFMLFPNPATPRTSLFAFDHLSPECFWRPEWQAHPNGARRVLKVVQTALEFGPIADYYAGVFGPERIERAGDQVIVKTGTAEFTVLTPDAIAAGYPEFALATGLPCSVALTLGVDDLDATARWFAATGIHAQAINGGLRIGPDQACGNILDFTAG